ncbi:MAG TPA: phospholipase A [Telluria sp.]
MNPGSKLLFSSLLAAAALPAAAADVEQQLLRCSALGDASARLGCFDTLAKATGPAPASEAALAAAASPAVAGAAAPAAAGATNTSVTIGGAINKAAASAAATAAAAEPSAPPESPISRMVQRWEVDQGAKRGRFAFRPHHDTYLLLANYSTATNDQPAREFTPAGIKSKHVEITYQLSFKLKLLEGILDTPLDLWMGYTQQSFWQAYNRAASSPFRETNYQPEIMLVAPVNKHFAGLDWRYVNLGAVHHSNGQTGSLSRSWNRLYAEIGADRGNFGISARIWRRLDNAKSNNDNPDITDFMGNGDLRASYRNEGHEYSVMLRRNFRTNKGALQAGWAFPVARNLKGYVQLFTGYGQSLIDYNYSQKSLGIGAMMDF